MKELLTLKSRSEFLHVAKGKSVAAKGLVLQAMKREEGNSPRLGFTVSRKIGSAVIRNRVKRRLKEVAKEVLGNLAENDYDYVLIGRKNAEKRPFEGLIKDLKYAFYQIHGK